MKIFLYSGDFFPHGSPKCVLRLQTTFVKVSVFLEKEFLYKFFSKASENILDLLVKCADCGLENASYGSRGSFYGKTSI